MSTIQTRADSFVHAFAEELLERADLHRSLDVQTQQRYVAELERAIHQRLGVAAFERLGEQEIQDVVKDFLHGASSEQLTTMLKSNMNPPSNFIEKELEAFSAEFLEAVQTNAN